MYNSQHQLTGNPKCVQMLRPCYLPRDDVQGQQNRNKPKQGEQTTSSPTPWKEAVPLATGVLHQFPHFARCSSCWSTGSGEAAKQSSLRVARRGSGVWAGSGPPRLGVWSGCQHVSTLLFKKTHTNCWWEVCQASNKLQGCGIKGFIPTVILLGISPFI